MVVDYLRKFVDKESNPRKGLFSYEWVMLAYLLFTLVVAMLLPIAFSWGSEFWFGRMRIVAITFLLWGAYNIYPCRLTHFARALYQMSLLAWWYPDTYELNKLLPNLDHLFAQAEQVVFGCQPALLFSQACPWPFFSELMDLGYASYFPIIAFVTIFHFLCIYEKFDRCIFITMASFFIFYVIFVLLPVTGPQYYYGVIGLDQVAEGIFPNVYDYFSTHSERMTSPGWTDGFFYQMVESAHNAGERPTAAFPSSHIGMTCVMLLLAWYSRYRRIFYYLLPFFLLMFAATVYIQAHYLIDAVAGLLTGILFYYALSYLYEKFKL